MSTETPTADQPDKTDIVKVKEPNEALTPVQKMAFMVKEYGTKLVGDERAQRFAATLMIMANNNPKIAQAITESPESVMSSMMACVQLNLMPNTPEQHAFLIPYFNNGARKMELQFQAGYKGLIVLVHRSNMVKSMAVELVFEGDKHKVKFGTTRQLIHEPNFDVDRTDYSKVIAAYATAVLANGEKVFELMTRKELDKVKDSAKAKSTDAPWNTWPDAMAKKTVIKRFTKMLPSSREDNQVALAAQFDSWAEAAKLQWKEGQLIEAGDVDPEEESKRRKELMANASKEHENLSDPGFTPTPVPPVTEEPKA